MAKATKVQLKREIYTYHAPWNTYALAWSNRKENHKSFRLAVGSFKLEYTNVVNLVQLNPVTEQFDVFAVIKHPYPATQVLWQPFGPKDLLATTGDYLRLWQIDDELGKPKVSLKMGFNNNSHSEFCAPITSFDWNYEDPNVIGTSSIDTTCTMWDLEAGKATIQLIAHEKEVFDLSFAADRNNFASVGADGSVRMFDLRNLKHSIILYESQEEAHPLMRVQWNKADPNYIAAMEVERADVMILDIRKNEHPLKRLSHDFAANGFAWAPHSGKHICSAGEDTRALIWNLEGAAKKPDPILSYKAAGSINKIRWSNVHPDWIGISYDNKIQTLRV